MVEWEKHEDEYWKSESYFHFPFSIMLSESKRGNGLQARIDFANYNYKNGQEDKFKQAKKWFEEYIENLQNLETHEKRVRLLESQLKDQHDYTKRLEDKLERMENILYSMNPPLTYEI